METPIAVRSEDETARESSEKSSDDNLDKSSDEDLKSSGDDLPPGTIQACFQPGPDRACPERSRRECPPLHSASELCWEIAPHILHRGIV
jgi:hypothetical protein